MHIGEFYIAYGKFLMLEPRYQAAVMAAIDSLIKNKGEKEWLK